MPAFYGTRKFIAVCTKTHHLSQTCDTLIQATSCHFISLSSLPTLSSRLQLLLTGVLSVIYHPTYSSLTGVSAKLPETDSSMAGCKDCAYRPMHHVWCPPPIYAMLCTESVKTDEEGRKRQVAWERRDTGRDPTQWLCPHEKQPSYNASHLAYVFYSIVKDAPMFTKHDILKA